MTTIKSSSPYFHYNPTTQKIKIDLPENTAPGTVLAVLSVPDATFLDIAVGGPDWLDFDVTENDDGSWSLRWEGLNAPDFEAKSAQDISVTFDIYAEDEHGDILLDVLDVSTIVSIVDVDEKPTEVIFSGFVTELAEGTYDKGLYIGSVQIIDDAQGTNSFTPLPENSPFEYRNVNGNSAELWLKSGTVLDYETVQSLTVTLAATGTGTGDQPSALPLTFQITDVDEPAELTSAGAIYMDENPSYRQIVTRLTADDPDAGDGPVRFYLGRSGDSALFRIHPSTGDLSVRTPQAFDYETRTVFEIEVFLRSSAGGDDTHREKVTVKIHLNDVLEAGEVELIQKADAVKGLALGKVNFGGEGASYSVLQNGGVSQAFAVIDGALTITADAGLDAGSYELSLVSSTSYSGLVLAFGASQTVTVVVNDITVPALSVNFDGEGGDQSHKLVLPADADGDVLSVHDVKSLKTALGDYSVKDGVLSFTPALDLEDGDTDTLSFQVSDGRGGVAELKVTVTIEVGAQRVFNVINGTDADDTIFNTTAGDDWINAGSGNDHIYGGRGDDVLRGEAGKDILWGGSDNDILIGGADADAFKFSFGAVATEGENYVLDFNPFDGDVLHLNVLDGAPKPRQLSLEDIQKRADLRWTNDSDAGRKNSAQITEKNDRGIHDTIIYYTKGTADTSDDVILIVLEDFTTELTAEMFEIW